MDAAEDDRQAAKRKFFILCYAALWNLHAGHYLALSLQQQAVESPETAVLEQVQNLVRAIARDRLRRRAFPERPIPLGKEERSRRLTGKPHVRCAQRFQAPLFEFWMNNYLYKVRVLNTLTLHPFALADRVVTTAGPLPHPARRGHNSVQDVATNNEGDASYERSEKIPSLGFFTRPPRSIVFVLELVDQRAGLQRH